MNKDQYPKSWSDHPDSRENVDVVTQNNIKISTYNYVFLKSCTLSRKNRQKIEWKMREKLPEILAGVG